MPALAPPPFHDPACIDSLGAYLELRRHDVTGIGPALDLLCARPVTPDAFDAVADGLYLLRLEHEDDAALARGSAPAVRRRRFARR